MGAGVGVGGGMHTAPSPLSPLPLTHRDRSALWMQLEINVLFHYCLISLSVSLDQCTGFTGILQPPPSHQ